MKFDLTLLIAFIAAASGCLNSSNCHKPYMEIGEECCLNMNEDKICDVDETTTTTTTLPGNIEYTAQEIILSEGDVSEIFGPNWTDTGETQCLDELLSTACRSYANMNKTLKVQVSVNRDSAAAKKEYELQKRTFFPDGEPFNVGSAGVRDRSGCCFYENNVFARITLPYEHKNDLEIITACRRQEQRIRRYENATE